MRDRTVTRTLLRLRWPLLGVLAVLLVAVPSAAPAAPADTPAVSEEEKQKKIEDLEKQMAELQKQLAELKKPVARGTAPENGAVVEGTIPDDVLKKYTWRFIGPSNMGGRITAISVVESDPATYFIATASGGLLKTTNNGTTFQHTFDKEGTVSIGDVCVSQSNPDIVWVGSGEANPRNSVSYGDGVYKSTDGGKTWKKMGLEKTFQIGKIIVHPKTPDTVYVGALGRLYGPNPDRGVYKTTDGGKTWDKVLYVDDKTGVIDMVMDPKDPNTLIAALWERKRDEHDGFFGEAPVPDSYGPIVTHGPGGGLWKSTDAGKTWKKLTDEVLKNGLPTVKTGRIGLDYSRKTKGLIFAIIDTEKVGTGTVSRVYLGVTGPDETSGPAKIVDVTEEGPAEKAGLKAGDEVIQADDKKLASYDALIDYIQSKNPGDKVKLIVKRGDKEVTLDLTLGTRPASETPAVGGANRGPGGGRGQRPGTGAAQAPYTGVTFAADKLTITAVTGEGPAEKAGIKVDDVITKVDGKAVADRTEYQAALAGKQAGDKVKLTITRGKESKEIEVTLAQRPATGGGGRGAGGGGAAAQAQPAAGANTLPLPGFVPELGGEGVRVGTVTKDGPADKAGIKPGDVVTAVNGREVANFRDFLTALRVGPRVEDPRKAGAKVKITFKQGDKTKEVELVLVDTPSPFGAGGGRGASATRPYGMGLGGQQANVQGRQGKDGYQTGGVFVSKDNGDTWTRVNSFNSRPMYFSVIRVDPNDDNALYFTADTPTPVYRSTDGGKTIAAMQTAGTVHADAHALWIDPANSKHLIVGCDGGFYVTYDKGQAWEHLNHLALGQFYHVCVDNRRPYRVYGGLQDNGSWGGPSRTLRQYGPVTEDWVTVGGGDGFVCRVDPTDPDIVYTESQGGAMGRRNLRTGEQAGIRPRRDQNAEPLRFNWNTPYILSHHNPSIFYCGAQFVFRSVKRGDDLKQISPDLTRSKKGSMTALAESPRTPDVLWAGTDDGNLWVSKDGGAKWDNVATNFASAGVPGPRWVATIEPSKEKDGRCYVVLDGHRSDDDKPYVLATEDFGNSWKSLNANLPTFGSTRCLREDITNPNILYLGTEFGAWVSANKGASWGRLGGNLPTVAVHEFAQPTTAHELVVATHGRSVWVTDVTSLRQMKPSVFKDAVTLFAPSPGVRWRLQPSARSPYSSAERAFVGQNPPTGTAIEYYLAKKAEKVSVKIVDVSGKTVYTFDNQPAGGAGGRFGGGGGGGGFRGQGQGQQVAAVPLSAAGMHRLPWALTGTRPPAAAGGQGAQGGGVGRGNFGAPGVAPGMYRVVLTVDDKEYSQPVLVESDPNAPRDLIAIGGGSDEDDDEEAREKREAEEALKKAARIDD